MVKIVVPLVAMSNQNSQYTASVVQSKTTIQSECSPIKIHNTKSVQSNQNPQYKAKAVQSKMTL